MSDTSKDDPVQELLASLRAGANPPAQDDKRSTHAWILADDEVPGRYAANLATHVKAQMRRISDQDFASDAVYIGQRVRLARPHQPENLGWEGTIRAIGPVEHELEQCRGDCIVEWDNGAETPQTLSQLLPLDSVDSNAPELDTDPSEDEEVDGRVCPVCDEFDCNDHLVAAIDDGDGILAGAMYGVWAEICTDLKQALMTAVVYGQAATGRGAEMDALLVEVKGLDFGWDELLAETDRENWVVDDSVRAMFYEVTEVQDIDRAIHLIACLYVANDPAVESVWFEIDTAPGLSWSGYNYYATDPDAAAARICAELSGVRDYSRFEAEPTRLLVKPDHGNAPFLWMQRIVDGRWRGHGMCCEADSACKQHPMSTALLEDFSKWAIEFELAVNFSTGKTSLDWPDFHARGIALAKRLKIEVGSLADVVYAKADEDPTGVWGTYRLVFADGGEQILQDPGRVNE